MENDVPVEGEEKRSQAIEPLRINPSAKRHWMVWTTLSVVVLLVVVAGLYSSFLGARIFPGARFKILGPREFHVGESMVITWDASPANIKRYPFEKIEYCVGKPQKKRICFLLASSVPNTGRAVVKAPPSLPLGKGYFRFTARDPKRKLLWQIVATSGTVTVKPAKIVSDSNGGGSDGAGGSDGGGGGSGDGGGGSTPTPTPSTAGVHISYFDESNQKIKYATNVSGSWVATTIDNGSTPELVLDGHGKSHIIYYSSQDLKYTTNASGGWVTATIDSIGSSLIQDGIAIDTDNKVHISYIDESDVGGTPDLKYATNASGSWVITTVDANATDGVGEYTSIVVDRNNKVHIGYYDGIDVDGGHNYWKYATNVSGSWTTEIFDSQMSNPGPLSIKTDSQNKVHLSYRYFDVVNSNRHLRYATNASGSWVITTADSTVTVEPNVSLVLDAQDKAHVSYYDSSAKDLLYATNLSGSWMTTPVDTNGSVGSGSAIAIDSQGKLHISYHDSTNTDLKYATNASGSWTIVTVDSAGSVGFSTSIGVSQ